MNVPFIHLTVFHPLVETVPLHKVKHKSQNLCNNYNTFLLKALSELNLTLHSTVVYKRKYLFAYK